MTKADSSHPDFLAQARRCVQSILAQLETQDAEGVLELDESPEGLSIALTSGRSLLLSIHRTSGEMWLASPISGGLHFRFHAAAPHWRLGDGRELHAQIESDLRALSAADHWTLQADA